MPRFLEILRDLQPIILLASFSLVIATFAAPLSPTAAGYATAAAMAFLTAFILILAEKVLLAASADHRPFTFTLSAYASVALGIVLLFLVPGQIAQVIPTIRPYSGWAYAVATIVTILWFVDIDVSNLKKARAQHAGRWTYPVAWAVSAVGITFALSAVVVSTVLPDLSQNSVLVLVELGGLGMVIAGTVLVVGLRRLDKHTGI